MEVAVRYKYSAQAVVCGLLLIWNYTEGELTGLNVIVDSEGRAILAAEFEDFTKIPNPTVMMLTLDPGELLIVPLDKLIEKHRGDGKLFVGEGLEGYQQYLESLGYHLENEHLKYGKRPR